MTQNQRGFDELLAACQEFIRKVECGEARSVRSYAQMKEAVEIALGEHADHCSPVRPLPLP